MIKNTEEDDTWKYPDKQSDIPIVIQNFTFYIKPSISYPIFTKNWGQFCAIAGFVYIFHFLWAIAGCNMYSDYTRLNPCNEFMIPGESSSQHFDKAIMIVTIFHIIEWLRWALFITSALVEVNLIPIFYMLKLNIPFGFFACAFCIV